MSTRRQRRAARANGKKSHGPVTPEGKARSAANSTRHGLASPIRLAESVCLTNESITEFAALHDALIAEHAPATTTQHLLVEEMAVCRWRLQRCWIMETALIDNKMDHSTEKLEKEYENMDDATRIALAVRDLAKETPAVHVLERYEARLSRQFDRCLRRLESMQARRVQPTSSDTTNLLTLPVEPNPKNGHQENATQCDQSAPAQSTLPAAPASQGRKPAITTPETAPEMDVFRSGSDGNGSDPVSGPPSSLPRAA